MKISAIGGTGLIGSQVVNILNASGHDAVPHAPSTGLDLLSGRGLPEALEGAGVVVNLTNSPTFDDASPAFFQQTMDNLLPVTNAAGVGHPVVLSIVGAGLAYYRGKVLQEDILKAGAVPFMGALLSKTADENTVRLPATLIQPSPRPTSPKRWPTLASAPRCRAHATSPAPEVFALDELGRITLAAHADNGTVVTDNSAGMLAAASGRRPHCHGRRRNHKDHLSGVARP
jgi:uncharacterized protein YbjT (DUF2867 family)